MPRILSITLAALIILIVGTLGILNPSITGHISFKTHEQPLNLISTHSQEYLLTSEEPIQMTSLSVSGRVEGDGIVEVNLITRGQKRLIYSNLIPDSINSITGIVTGTNSLILSSGQTLEQQPTKPGNAITTNGAFVQSCIESCAMTKLKTSRYTIQVLIQDGTTLYLDTLTYTTPE